MTEKERAAFEKFKADYNELCHLKDMKIAILEEQLAQNIKDHTKLQMENAEFKKQLIAFDKERTEAKEILSKLLNCVDCVEHAEIFDKAEDFLKEYGGPSYV